MEIADRRTTYRGDQVTKTDLGEEANSHSRILSNVYIEPRRATRVGEGGSRIVMFGGSSTNAGLDQARCVFGVDLKREQTILERGSLARSE